MLEQSNKNIKGLNGARIVPIEYYKSNDQLSEIYNLNLTSIADFGLANQFKMRSNDIVYVDASGLARWQRVVNQMIPFSSVLYQLDNLGK